MHSHINFRYKLNYTHINSEKINSNINSADNYK